LGNPIRPTHEVERRAIMTRILLVLGLLVPLLFSLPRLERAADSTCSRLDDARYLGSKSCQKCHYKEYASWQKTSMAKAFESLKPNTVLEAKKRASLDPTKDYTKESACVACHVTGYGKPGGYPEVGKDWSAEEIARAASMEGVGCEACHGPGELYSPLKKENKDYKWSEIIPVGAVHPDAQTCTSCHNKQSPSFQEFKFEDKIGKDTHEVLKLKRNHECPHQHAEGK
jgi:hypothetical protein